MKSDDSFDIASMNVLCFITWSISLSVPCLKQHATSETRSFGEIAPYLCSVCPFSMSISSSTLRTNITGTDWPGFTYSSQDTVIVLEPIVTVCVVCCMCYSMLNVFIQYSSLYQVRKPYESQNYFSVIWIIEASTEICINMKRTCISPLYSITLSRLQ